MAYDMRSSDWSSDVCSSDLGCTWATSQAASSAAPDVAAITSCQSSAPNRPLNRCGKAEPSVSAPTSRAQQSGAQGRRVSVRVDLGGRRLHNKKNHMLTHRPTNHIQDIQRITLTHT